MSQGHRRLAAIMYTDMVGYTALGQRNESLSLALVDEQRKLVRPVLVRHGGREVKTIGDAFLVEFPSALDAVRCAYDIQRASREFNISQPVDRRIRLRVGLHVGDIEESDGDIFGDAVNVASRIEPLAQDGGVCLTRQVHDQVQNKFDLPFSSLGTRPLKNVSQPMEVYTMVMPWDKETTSKSWQLDKKRIAVLPFANISPDPADEYFADGTTEEMISTLCGISDLTVISRTSVMQYKGAKKNLADIGRELKTGTILEGSVRKAGNRVRITVQLLDVADDKHLWTQSYDRELQDIFGVQSDIARSVAGAVRVELLSTTSSMVQKRPTTNIEAYLCYLKGRLEWNKRSEEGARRAIGHFTQALHHDSNFSLAYVGLADSYFIMEARGAMTSAEATENARRAISRALQLDERLAEAHASYARLLEYDRNWDAAEAEYLKALELNRSYASAHQWYSFLLGEEGRWESALAEAETALELDPLSAVMLSNVAHRLLFMERYNDALEYAKRSLAIQPDLLTGVVSLVLAYAYKGESVEAIARWEEYSQTRPEARAMVFLAAVQALVGKSDEALRTLDSASKLDDFKKVPPTLVAWAFAALHNEDKTFEWLEKALEQQDTMITSINDNIVFKELHSRTRYREILKRLGLDRC